MTQPSGPLHKWGLKSEQIQQFNAKDLPTGSESLRSPPEPPEGRPQAPEQIFRARAFPEP